VETPWGQGTLEVVFPEGWPEPDVVRPDLSGATANYRATLAEALDAAGGFPALAPGERVAVVVDDPSRWTPVREALPVILGRLHGSGVSREDISISVGVGRHAAVTEEAMRERVGAEVSRSYACHSPPVDDLPSYVDLGTTPEGVPVRVFGPVARASLRILVGSVLPHLQAGFGGGLKLVFPGCSHRSTLSALHRQGLGRGAGDASRLLGGEPASNPMRRAIVNAAALLPGSTFSVSHLLGPPGTVLNVAAGEPGPVQDDLAHRARLRYAALECEPADIVVASNHPWPGDPMQSFKVLLNHRASASPRGVLVGLFWTDPEEMDRSFPLGPMKAIAASGAVGGSVIRRGLRLADRVATSLDLNAAFMVRWARELVADRAVLVYSPALRQRLGPRLGPVRLYDDQASLWHDAAAATGQAIPRSVRLFPIGGLTYCPSRLT
jgi:hypothetical protein